jgi:hypothetical protein
MNSRRLIHPPSRGTARRPNGARPEHVECDDRRMAYALPSFARPASVRVLRKPGWVLLRKLDGKPGRLAAAARSRACAPVGRPGVCMKLTTSKGHDGVMHGRRRGLAWSVVLGA